MKYIIITIAFLVMGCSALEYKPEITPIPRGFGVVYFSDGSYIMMDQLTGMKTFHTIGMEAIVIDEGVE